MYLPSIEDLSSIFYSGQYAFTGNKEPIIKLHFLIQQEYLNFKKIVIATKETYLELLSKTDQLKAEYDADGGGLNHIALKLLARDHLKSQGLDARFEQPFCGYYPDVITTDVQTIVECGHTDNVEKIFTYFMQGTITKLIQLPYPSHEDTNIHGYQFTPNNDLQEFLEAVSLSERDQIRSILNRKDR